MFMLKKYLIITLTILTGCIAFWANNVFAAKNIPFVVSGVLVNSGNAKLIERFVDYLSTEANLSIETIYVDNYSKLSNILRQNPHALGWTCGAPYVEDNQKDGQQLITVPLFNGKPEYRSLVITRKERPETELAHFKNQVMAYSDKRSNSGFVAPAFDLHKKGLNIRNYFRLLLHAGTHERSIEAVATGLADVANVDEYIWVEYNKVRPKIIDQLKVIDKTGPYPFTPIVAGSSVSSSVIKNLQSALVSLKSSESDKDILDLMGIDGFVIKDNTFFKPIKEMMTKLQILSDK